MTATQYTSPLYSEAVHHAMMNTVSAAISRRTRIEMLRELLYSLGESIPNAWNTSARPMLERREHSVDRITHALSSDLAYSSESARYQVLSSVLLVALTIKQSTGFLEASN